MKKRRWVHFGRFGTRAGRCGIRRRDLQFQHAECPFFGPDHDKFVRGAGARISQWTPGRAEAHDLSASALTEAWRRPCPPLREPALAAWSIRPPPARSTAIYSRPWLKPMSRPRRATNDYEFIRRVTLDLTGPHPDGQPSDQLCQRTPRPTSVRSTSRLCLQSAVGRQVDHVLRRFPSEQLPQHADRALSGGVAAFNTYIRNSLTSNKPYDQMAREIIAATGTDSYTQGELNWLVGGVVTGGPMQDIWDQQTANIADTFLGIAHVNCLLCHNGRGHLDALSLWGAQTTRQQAWGLSSFLSHTDTSPRDHRFATATSITGASPTTRARRELSAEHHHRQPAGRASRSARLKNIAPTYMFSGQTPTAGENYRAALARIVTSDFQFARATVNYMWAQFLRRGTGGSAGSVRSAAARSGQSAHRAWPRSDSLAAAALESAVAERAGAGFRQQQLRPEVADARDREFAGLSAFVPL